MHTSSQTSPQTPFRQTAQQVREQILDSAPQLNAEGRMLQDVRALAQVVDRVCEIVSKKLLDIVFREHKLVDHLKAIRRSVV
jgi:hypothetical protein